MKFFNNSLNIYLSICVILVTLSYCNAISNGKLCENVGRWGSCAWGQGSVTRCFRDNYFYCCRARRCRDCGC
ncbi:uncharacterized protein BX664DRAFT_330561 [Halteromyces radiatus]|uniref:uncharacterized protein n=1 Tax=Halteromyces radiatus TaxID=101107 RepID=UPI00221FEF5D|nr:uncharacterized protein BX664DRAFT_330561 [Halteromyces radiatus]KAI8093785.1 hypothetical protein BX664DRAFT_330561 [Halteromyces radiatus]